MSGETLKPCPWCGGEAEISQIGNEHTKSRGFEVKCKTWGCSTVKRALVVRHTMAEARLFAVERWNTRPTPTVEGGETQPVAWRVKDFADDWVLCRLEGGARQAVQDGFHVEPLYSADALASRDAEIERLRGERDDLRWAVMGGEDAPGVLDTVAHEEVLKALQENRSNWKSYGEMAASQRDAALEALERARGSLRKLQTGAATAMMKLTEDGPVFDFLTAIYREAVSGQLSSDEPVNTALASLSPAKDEEKGQ